MDLRDRHVVVTGAAGGIGRSTALRLAAGGARVACVDLDASGAEEVVRAIEVFKGRCIEMRSHVVISKK